jgi:methylmalonyl-CoA/ethylmalonyl-CoA epimerase
MLDNIHHIGVAVKSVEKAKHLFGHIFGLPLQADEVEPEYQVHLANFQVGSVQIEFLEGLTDQSTISKFIEKRGEGVHHICFEVEDIQGALQRLEAAGVDLIDAEPRTIRHGLKVAFLKPAATHGILIELIEVPRSSRQIEHGG